MKCARMACQYQSKNGRPHCSAECERLERESGAYSPESKCFVEGKIVLPPEGIELRNVLHLVERTLIAQALAESDGNRYTASVLLGCNRTTLVEKMRRLGFALNRSSQGVASDRSRNRGTV